LAFGPAGSRARHTGHKSFTPYMRSPFTHDWWYTCPHGSCTHSPEDSASRHIAHSPSAPVTAFEPAALAFAASCWPFWALTAFSLRAWLHFALCWGQWARWQSRSQ
jgi:hypothetical protein